MSYDSRVIIERATNGYTVNMKDPKIVAANAARDYSSKPSGRWQDPDRSYVFTTMEALTKFLTDNLDKALPAGDYGSTFDAVSGEINEDDD